MFDFYNYHTKKITAPSSHPCTLCAHVLMLNASDAAVTDAAAATDRKRRRRAAGEKSLDFILRCSSFHCSFEILFISLEL